MLYPLTIDWIALALCALLVLPWLLGGVLVIKDLKERYERRKK